MNRTAATLLGVLLAGAAIATGVATSPSARKAVRPALKAGIRGIALASLLARRKVAEMGEAWEDLVAEIGADLAMAGTPAASTEPQPEPAPTPKPPARKRKPRKTA
jgi:hypothetical protein